jgi:hypothetical protein
MPPFLIFPALTTPIAHTSLSVVSASQRPLDVFRKHRVEICLTSLKILLTTIIVVVQVRPVLGRGVLFWFCHQSHVPSESSAF